MDLLACATATAGVPGGGDSDTMPAVPLDLKRKVKTFPPNLEWVTDQGRKDFILAMEVDTNKRVKQHLDRFSLHSRSQYKLITRTGLLI